MPFSLFISIWTLALLIPLGFIIHRIYRNRATKAATDRFGKQLQQNPTLGEAFAQTLYKPVGWIQVEPGLDNKNLSTRLNSLPNQADGFLIHYRQWVSKDSYLLVTTMNYLQPSVLDGQGIGGWITYPASRVIYSLNFVVKLDALKKQVIVLSDLYSTLVDKNLRADFATAIFKMLQM